jgi:hypothetical protein
MAVTSTAGLGRPRRWLAGLAWVLWALAMLGLAVVPWMDRLTIRAGRPDLTNQWQGPLFVAVLGHLTATTVGAVLASRRPRHPVGWLLLGFPLALTASGVIASYVAYGLLARPGALPAAATVARYYPATGPAGLALLSFVLLLTPTESLPSPRWRRWAFITAATPVALVLVVAVMPGRLDPAAAGDQQSLQRSRPGRCPADRHPGHPGRHRPGCPGSSAPGRCWCASAAPAASNASKRIPSDRLDDQEIKQARPLQGGGRVGHKIQRLELTRSAAFRSPQHGASDCGSTPARRLHELGTC